MVKHIILVAVAVCAAGGACWAGGARDGAGPRVGRELTKAVDAFGINFLQEAVNLEPTKNVVTSPLSASALFALLSLGADGETHDEIINVLKLKDDDFEAVNLEPTKNVVTSPLSASALSALFSLGADGETHDEIINVLKLNMTYDDDFEAVNLEATKNVVTSPLSASALSALFSLGADGETHDEIINVLKLNMTYDDDFTRAAFKEAIATLVATPNVTLEVVNRLFIADNGFTLAPAFQNDATDVFNAGLETINFNRDKEAAKTINQYVEGATHNRIKDLIGDSDLTSDTRLVLINAIYFKGKWKTPFRAMNTLSMSFFPGPARMVQVPTMSIQDKYDYAESDNLSVQIVELPYVGEEVSMLVVLPRSKNGLGRLLQNLATRNGVAEIVATAQRLAPKQVDLRLPRFKVETEVDLKEVFTKLGAGKAFDPKQADLSRLATGAEPLYVFKAAQKAFVEVNEEGAKAAAASGFGARISGISVPTEVEFHADRPFLWFLRTRRTQLTLFSGVYRGL